MPKLVPAVKPVFSNRSHIPSDTPAKIELREFDISHWRNTTDLDTAPKVEIPAHLEKNCCLTIPPRFGRGGRVDRRACEMGGSGAGPSEDTGFITDAV